MSSPWTRFVQQVTDIPGTIDFYINTLGTGPSDDLEQRRPVPWEDGWVWTSEETFLDLPGEGNPNGRIPAEVLASAETATYAGIGGCLEIEFDLDCDGASQVEAYPLALGVDDESTDSRRRWDLDALFEMHRGRGVAVVSEPGTQPWGFYAYTIQDPNGYHMTVRRSEPGKPECESIVVVPDLRAAVAYYENVLGFTGAVYSDDAPGCTMFPDPGIELREDPELAARVSRHMISVYGDDVDATCPARKANGAMIVDDLADKPWGMRQYVVEDLNGYRLRFA